MYRKIILFFDRLEDKVRGQLSRSPILYAIVGGVGIVLFWRGVWHSADSIPYLSNSWVSTLVGSIILLLTGVFVSAFIGSRLIMTGLRGEKKTTEKTKEELDVEESQIENMQNAVKKIENEVEALKKDFEEHNPDK